MSGLLGFLASNTHLAARNLKFRTEIKPECGEDVFFYLHLNLWAKFRAEIQLKFNQTLQKHFALSEFAKSTKIDAYG